ncbi:MAG: 6,7-dimethyl-8-ribityllumazine synthase [Chitinophagia bacterium]|nr:6,7-dimethyl-8-ribityllumazine synthase [Chitinophagia bacterium]
MAQITNSPLLLNTDSLQQLNHPRVAIISTEWNSAIVQELINGFTNVFSGQFKGSILEHWKVPGSFEIPFACRQLWTRCAHKATSPEAIVAFGAVIRGGTPHFEYVSGAVTDGLLQLNLTLPVPVIFGVLTLDNEQQAWERLGGSHGHKGEEAAITALKMIELCRK